jgi:propanol-preferring alcohol dehydrogenase
MRAWVVRQPARYEDGGRPLALVEREKPVPGPREIRVQVSTCAVCRTDLHLAEGDLPPHRPETTPGHEIVGVVEASGADCTRFSPGERVGIAWLRYTCGRCHWCRTGAENLCPHARFTGWDADGGYAQYAVIDERFAYALPDEFDDLHVAPLLCAGIIGYRALRLAQVPKHGRLGIYGFGGSAHLTAQIAVWQGISVHVRTRSPTARLLATELGAASVGDSGDEPEQPFDAAIIFAPAGELVPVALRALNPGGTAAVAGIHLSDIPVLNYDRDLFGERVLRSVTANTRADGEEFLAAAAAAKLRISATPYPFEAADAALADLAADRITGAAVLTVGADRAAS